MSEAKKTSQPQVRIGHVKTFGPFGPAYLVTGAAHSTNQIDWLVPFIVHQSGELDYPYAHFAEDPDELSMHSKPTQAQRDELDRRLNDVRQHPNDGISWELPKDQLIDRV